jgi:hypothetical protein
VPFELPAAACWIWASFSLLCISPSYARQNIHWIEFHVVEDSIHSAKSSGSCSRTIDCGIW